jgi:hypothetical protein
MVSPSAPRTLVALFATLGAVSCATPQSDTTTVEGKESQAGMFLHGQLQQNTPKPLSAPPGAHLQYFGGRIVSNLQVVQVIYGTGSYLPQITDTSSPSVATFYQGVLNSPYVDWLTEYNTVGQPPPTSNQVLGRGSFSTQVTITPSAANNGTVIDDVQIQAELSAQIAAGNLPPPTHDAAGNNNTYYATFFPHGKTLTLQGQASCQVFCAYHSTIASAGGQGEIYYGVHPDFQPGSGCEFGCGAAATPFGNVTQVASHEMVETMTDAEVGLASVFGPPLAWADTVFSEIGDICNDQNNHIVGADGITYDVQNEFSNSLNDCIVSNPAATPVTATTAGETCRGTTALATVTLLGGAGRFVSPVTLSVTGVSPTPPTGGEITATFDPNPVPTPAANGSTSTMRIASTPLTPPGTYTVTIQASSAELTRTTTTQVVIRSQVPNGPTLTSPVNGADGVPQAATFTWSPVDQATQYELDVFSSGDCSGAPIQTFTTGNTNFTVPNAQALATFQNFSWHVSANNSCGSSATSACFNFRTASCSDPHELVTNGGFESGFAGWTIEQSVPPPVVSSQEVHTGASSALLGTVIENQGEPLGDSQISQTLTLSSGSTPTLSFWEWPLSDDSVTFDQQYVRVQPISPAGPVVVLMNEARNDRTFIHRTFDLSPFAGQTVKLIFGVHQDGFGDVTSMFVDDISVSSQNCGPPDFAVRANPVTSGEVCAGQSLQFSVAVDSVNGPNFASPVTLSAGSLPPGATATFANNPVSPGGSTIMTLTTARPTNGSQFTISVNGVAVNPPPTGTRTASTALLVDPNTPNAPEIVSPAVGAVNVPRRPTLSWTSPFVPDAGVSGGASTAASGAAPVTVSQPGTFAWQLAATTAPAGNSAAVGLGVTPAGGAPSGAGAVTPFAFGASSYHLQIARDAAFSNLVVDTTLATTSFTVGVDLDIATQYFWRVTATNACGTSAFSATGSFIVGACFEGWNAGVATPVAGGPLQSTVIGSTFDNKLYVIGGGTGAGPDVRIDQVWAFDPLSQSWTRKADVPSPGVGSNFGSAAQIGGFIYVFGGVTGPPAPVTVTATSWKYDIAGNTWTRIKDLPTTNFGSAVAAIGGKIYLAFGSGFVQQTWQYDPATDTYTRKTDAPVVPSPVRLHAVVLGGQMHAFAGGFEGNAHVIYNPANDTWTTGPVMPFTATDPAVGVLGGKAFVVGGRPTAHTQIFDPAIGIWSQASPIGLATGVDNTAGAVLGATFHLIGGFNGTTGINTHQQFHTCSLGALSSASLLPFVIDGNGKKTGIGNEATALLINNSISGTAMSVSCFLYGTSGNLLGNQTISVAPGELKTVGDVVRALTGTTTVQNTIGSLQMFGTEVFQGMASVVNNASSDPMFEDGQPIAGSTSGFLSTVGTSGYLTQTVFANASTTTSVVQVLAYPAAGGSTPLAGTVAFVPAHGLVSYTDVVKQLGLTASYSGQLSWSASQPIAVMARDTTKSKSNFSGALLAHNVTDTASTTFVSYVEDTSTFSTALELSNPGPITANVTVKFVQTSDATGASSGVEHSRDIPVAVNSGTPIADIVRWTQFSTAPTPSGQHGFVVVTAPQGVIAGGRLVNGSGGDVGYPNPDDGEVSGPWPLIIRFTPQTFAQVGMGAAATPSSESRVALSNPGTAPVTVNLTAFNATGSVAGTFSVTLAPDGQYLTEDLGAAMDLPPVFLGWVQMQSSGPVLVYNHRRSGNTGAIVPIHGQ